MHYRFLNSTHPVRQIAVVLSTVGPGVDAPVAVGTKRDDKARVVRTAVAYTAATIPHVGLCDGVCWMLKAPARSTVMCTATSRKTYVWNLPIPVCVHLCVYGTTIPL